MTYKIRPFEKQLPTEGELRTRAQADTIAMLAEAFAKEDAHPEDVSLARRLLTHDRAEHILAGLLRNHLGDRVKAQEAAAETRRGRRPRPAGEESQRRESPAPHAPRIERPPAGGVAAVLLQMLTWLNGPHAVVVKGPSVVRTARLVGLSLIG